MRTGQNIAVGLGHIACNLPEGVLGARLVKPDIHKIKGIDDEGTLQLLAHYAAAALKAAGPRQLDKRVLIGEQQLKTRIAVKQAGELASVIPPAHPQVDLAVGVTFDDGGYRV